ncbi:MAG: tripartite tricarboxylate transporter substrate binding protein [Acidovorax sp.]|nr:tripartite tricarboxylate transporter substrate binding protein [Acidovorax sp.]
MSGLGMLWLALATSGAIAQTFPHKPIRLVVPFPAGGGTDAMARTLGESLSREFGQPVLVENKAGAGTVIGNDFVAKSAPDGHTLLLNTSAIAIVPSLFAKLPYAQDSAFAPIMLLGRAPNVAVVRADSPLKSAREFLAHAKSNPGKVAYGSAGNGTSTHLAAELLKSMAHMYVIHVPYRGASPLVTDLLAGQIDVGFGTLPSVAPFIASGKLRALGVTSGKRSPLLLDVPTFAEAGVAGYQADVWYGIFAAAGTPVTVVNQLYGALKRASETEAFRQRARAEGLIVTLDPPEETARIVRAEIVKWRKVVKEQSIKMD